MVNLHPHWIFAKVCRCIVIFSVIFFHRPRKERSRYACIVRGCNDIVRNLSRHLQSRKHDWSKESSKAAVHAYGLRKSYPKIIPSQPNTMESKVCENQTNTSLKMCPYPSCMSVVKRLDVHLRLTHSMERNNSYYSLLHSVKNFTPITLANSISPRKELKANTLTYSIATSNSNSNYCTKRNNIEEITELTAVTPEKRLKSNNTVDNVIPVSSVSSSSTIAEFKSTTETQLVSVTSEKSHLCNDDDPDYHPDLSEFISQRKISVKCTDVIESILDKFLKHLCGIERGSKPLESAKQICAEVRRVFFCINAERVEDIFKGDCLRDQYLMDYCVKRKHSALSIRKYLRSIGDFLSFLVIERVVLSVTPQDISQLKEKLSMWSKHYKSAADSRFWERQIEDYKVLVTPDEYNLYENSEHAVNAKQLFDSLKDHPRQVSSEEFCCMRDHLFSVIHFSNSHRSGVSAHVTLKEFHAAMNNNNSYIIYVREHKTFPTSGPAMITLTPLQFSWLNIYVTVVRPQIKTSSPYVFVSWCGGNLRSGAVSRQLNSMWKKAGLKSSNEKNLSCNIIRKSTTTGMRDAGTGFYQETADLMAHSVKTQQKHYALRQKERSASEAASVIRKFYQEGNKEKKDDGEQTLSRISSPSKKLWTVDEIQQLREVFRDDLNGNNISLKNVSLYLPNSAINATSQQVYDKLKSLVRYSPLKAASTDVAHREVAVVPVSNLTIFNFSSISSVVSKVIYFNAKEFSATTKNRGNFRGWII